MKRMKRFAVLMLAMIILIQGFAGSGIMVRAEEGTETLEQETFVSEKSTEESNLSDEAAEADSTEEGILEESSTEPEDGEETIKDTEPEEESQEGTDSLEMYETVGPKVSYSVHMQTYGWMNEVSDGEEAGAPDAGKRMEAIKIQISGAENLGISYQVFCDVDGWKSTCTDGDIAGTVGEGKRIEAVSMKLTGSAASQYELYYRVYVSGYGWLDWSWRGNIAGSDHSYEKSIEAVQIKVLKKGEAAPGSMAHCFLAVGDEIDAAVSNVWLSYSSYTNGGWLAAVSGGKSSGNPDSANLIEAIKINLNQSNYANSGITYCVQTQTYGWLDAVSDGTVSGNTGSGKRVEAIQIKLTGEIAEACDIYYRVYVESYGWLDWAKNGATAGTVELKKKMLAYEAVLVKKGGTAPGPVDKPALYGDGGNAEQFVNTHVNTGDHIQDLIAVAKTQIGYYVPEGSVTKFGTWYNTYVHATGNYYPSAPWCAMFVSWCAEEAGVPETIFRRHSSTVTMSSWYQNAANPGTWHNRAGYTPEVGDLIFFKFSTNNNSVNHVGIVTGVSGGKVYTIEGNSADSVAQREYPLNYSYIVGYATPDYSGTGNNGGTGVTPKTDVSYSVNVEGSGWGKTVSNGTEAGTTGLAKRMQAIKISVSSNETSGGITYRTHMQTYGWGSWVNNGAVSGIADGEKRMEAIEIKLTGALAVKYDIYYRVHCQSYGWLDWAKNGESAGTEGYAKRVEALEIRLVKKGESAPGKTTVPFVKKPASVVYSTHCQTYGWMTQVADGILSGTTGQAKRLEAIKISLDRASGGVTYRTHVQTYGWQSWVSDGAFSGTTREAKRLEAIQIKLTGEAAEQYDIYYRVHCQTYGWMGWAKNGEKAGSSGLAKRLEAIEIKLVPKGSAAPGSAGNCYIEG